MKTTAVTPADLARSVLAVAPLARGPDLALSDRENRRLVRHLLGGGVTTLLYGGNANLYNVGVGEFAGLLDALEGWAADDTWVIPSIAPTSARPWTRPACCGSAPFPPPCCCPSAFPPHRRGPPPGCAGWPTPPAGR